MTELAIREDRTADLAITDGLPFAPTRLSAWANDARQANLAAVSLARTAFVPASLRGRHADEAIAEQITVSQITAAILTGQEVGLEPMASLRSIDIIEGTPAMRAHALRGLVQGRGHEIWVEESTDTRAVVCGRRKGSTVVQKSTWTIDRAKKMGLAHKQNWTKQPAAMLVARATSEVCRWVGGDALLGMPYSAEELADGEGLIFTAPEQAAADDAAPAKPKRTVKRTPPPVPQELPEPELDEPAPPAEEMATDDQLKAMHTLFSALTIGARETRLRYVANVIGREVESSKELTKAEASQVINALDADATASEAAIEGEAEEWPTTPEVAA